MRITPTRAISDCTRHQNLCLLCSLVPQFTELVERIGKLSYH